jgi:hypothetical protein
VLACICKCQLQHLAAPRPCYDRLLLWFGTAAMRDLWERHDPAPADVSANEGKRPGMPRDADQEGRKGDLEEEE